MSSAKIKTNWKPIVITAVISALLAGVGVYYFTVSWYKGPTGTIENPTRFNCERSGGVYLHARCDCGELTYQNGYCITANGTPGGEMEEAAKRSFEEKMKSNQ